MPDGSGGKTDELDVRTDELDGIALELDVGTTVELDDDEGVGWCALCFCLLSRHSMPCHHHRLEFHHPRRACHTKSR